MTIDEAIKVVRNSMDYPYAYERQARLVLAAEVERLRNALSQSVEMVRSLVRPVETSDAQGVSFWKREAIAATRILKEARRQFPNDDGWLRAAIEFLDAGHSPVEPPTC